jgi:membrane protein DedA with SNARE-associated domain
MDILSHLLAEYGYIIVFFFTLLEGETIVALAGFSAFLGHLSLYYIIPVAILGAVIGDQAFFWFGRLKGKEFLAKRPYLQTRVTRIHRWTERYHGLLIVLSRFMYGFRAIIPITFGANGISPFRYFFFNVIGACIWAPVFAVGGYLFGNAVENFLGGAKQLEVYVVSGVLFAFLVVQIVLYSRRRSRMKEGERTASVEKSDA